MTSLRASRRLLLCALAAALTTCGQPDTARQQWDSRIEALRAAGQPLTPQAFQPGEVPRRDNAEQLLRDVYETYHEAWPEWPSPTMLPIEDPSGVLTADEREDLARWWPRLRPLYERLGEAAARPLFVATTDDPLGNEVIPWIQHAGRLWSLRARYTPADALRMAEQNLRVALAWRPRNHIEVMVRWGHFVLAADTLHEAAQAGQVDFVAARERLAPLLVQAETGWLDQLRLALRAQRACIVRYVAWCTGHEPVPEEVRDLDELADDSRPASRPRMYREALRELDRVEQQLRSIQGEADLRSATLQTGSDHPAVFYAQGFRGALLRTLATLRVTHVALVLKEEAASGVALDDELRAYADRFEGGLPRDPYTGRSFRWEKHPRGRLLAVDAASADPALRTVGFFCDVQTDDASLLEDGLAWILEDQASDR